MIKKIKLRDEVNIYRDLLISLHTARWTGNHEMLGFFLDKIAAYSYARTNSNGYEKEEEQQRRRTLLALDNWVEEWKVKKVEVDAKKKAEYEERLKNDPEFATLVEKYKDKK
jgi:hypothetical protein